MSNTTINAHAFAHEALTLSNTLVIDVRTPAEFSAISLPSSMNIPIDQLTQSRCESLHSTVTGKNLYLLCETGMRARKAREIICKKSNCKAIIIEGGINELRQYDIDLNESKSKVISLERQVRIAAGMFVFIGVILGFFVDTWFLSLSAFVGLGLMFAGITNTCGMAIFLTKMPWNNKKY